MPTPNRRKVKGKDSEHVFIELIQRYAEQLKQEERKDDKYCCNGELVELSRAS